VGVVAPHPERHLRTGRNTFSSLAKNAAAGSLERRAFERAVAIADALWDFRLAVHAVVGRLDAGEMDTASAAEALRRQVLGIPDLVALQVPWYCNSAAVVRRRQVWRHSLVTTDRVRSDHRRLRAGASPSFPIVTGRRDGSA
jgi:hypothetical protein